MSELYSIKNNMGNSCTVKNFWNIHWFDLKQVVTHHHVYIYIYQRLKGLWSVCLTSKKNKNLKICVSYNTTINQILPREKWTFNQIDMKICYRFTNEYRYSVMLINIIIAFNYCRPVDLGVV